MSIKICEFSRKLSDPIQTDGKWVSTGFDKEIGLRFGPESGVPEIIETAVNHQQFRLNDNYPPNEGKIGLIAKEFEQYAILVVANNLSDDKARPLIGYRYFWLEKPENTDIDGVGTLLKWWESKGQPCLELKPHEETETLQKENYKNGYYNAEIYQAEAFRGYYDQVEEISHQINETPYIFTVEENEENDQYPNYLQLHSLALHLHEKYNRPIVWTWNIFCLENPNPFTLIGCADEKDEKYFKWNKKHTNLFISLEQNVSSSLSGDTGQKTATNILKQAIQKIAEKKQVQDNINTLINELKNSNSVDWDWGGIIDPTWYKNHNQFQTTRYKSLILFLNTQLKIDQIDINPISWIESLKSSPDTQDKKKPSPVNEYATDIIELQYELFKSCYKDTKINNQLVPRINKIIGELLLDFSKSQENAQVIEWLFLASPKLWKERLKNYANDLFNQLYDYQQKGSEAKQIEEEDKFLLKIIEDLKYRQEKVPTNAPGAELARQNFDNQSKLYEQYNYSQQTTIKFPSYQPIAELFESIESYPLSAFFYQLSMGDVPSGLKKQCSGLPEIIPLKNSQDEQPTEPLNSRENTNQSNWKKNIGLVVLGIIIGIALGLPIQKFVKWYDKFWYSPISKNESKIISSTPIRELFLYFNLLESGDFRKDIQLKNTENLDKFISSIPNFGTPNFKQTETRPEFLKNRNNTLVKQPLYGYIKGLTPVKEKPSLTYKADEIDEKNPVKNIEIKQVKEVLKQPLGIYKGEINEIWDKETSEAIKVFQQQYEIEPSEGNLASETWKVLSIMIEDRQLEEAAKHLQSIIKESKNYKEFETKYNQMKKCKEMTAQLYSECLKERPKKTEETGKTGETEKTKEEKDDGNS
ncbi:MAG: peptidoglycan-binding domain-containing protein [Crocosphaera sp.]|nr:peptidoglycan-binding domain-containing protein [Crocosphaera sp.]